MRRSTVTFATEAAARATRLTLVGDIANAWLQLGADRSLLKIAADTAAAAQVSVRLTRARLEGGISSRIDLAQAQQILATAQADLAEQTTAVAQDGNALQLLVGQPVEGALLPATLDDATAGIRSLPAGIDSGVLLRRPDVVEAEYQLRAANAEIGAARAALFPRVSLTGLLGLASTALRTLFTGGAFTYSVAPSVTAPIFNAGAGRAGVAYSQAQRDAALASYERAIQTAFRENRRCARAAGHDRRAAHRYPDIRHGGGGHAATNQRALSGRDRNLPVIARCAAQLLLGAAHARRNAASRREQSGGTVSGARRRRDAGGSAGRPAPARPLTAVLAAPMLRNMATDPSAFFRTMLGEWEKFANGVGGDLLKTDAWSQAMNAGQSAHVEAQAAMKTMAERALAAANLPSRSEFADLSARIGRIESGAGADRGASDGRADREAGAPQADTRTQAAVGNARLISAVSLPTCAGSTVA